jgi:trimethylamine monooxygenase
MHSTDFRNALEFAGRKVVIVGNGNSGEDIALQCHKYGAEEVKLTYRTERSKVR